MLKAAFGVLSVSVFLVSCSSESGPTEEQLKDALGISLHDASCVPAQGEPGYMCTFTTDPSGYSITRRLVKADGGWKAVAGN